jgi:hypothetical protein
MSRNEKELFFCDRTFLETDTRCRWCGQCLISNEHWFSPVRSRRNAMQWANFSEGLAVVKIAGSWGFLNRGSYSKEAGR